MPECSKAVLVCPGANVIQDASHRPNIWKSSYVAQLLLSILSYYAATLQTHVGDNKHPHQPGMLTPLHMHGGQQVKQGHALPGRQQKPWAV